MLGCELGHAARHPGVALLVLERHEGEALGGGAVGRPDLDVRPVGQPAAVDVQHEVSQEGGPQEVAGASRGLCVLHEPPPLGRAVVGGVLLHVGAGLGDCTVHVERLAGVDVDQARHAVVPARLVAVVRELPVLRVRAVLVVDLHVGAVGLGGAAHVERLVAAVTRDDGVRSLGKLVLPRDGRARGGVGGGSRPGSGLCGLNRRRRALLCICLRGGLGGFR